MSRKACISPVALTGVCPGDAVKVDSAFELYLERGERGESWRLAIPSGSDDGASQAWITYPLAID